MNESEILGDPPEQGPDDQNWGDPEKICELFFVKKNVLSCFLFND